MLKCLLVDCCLKLLSAVAQIRAVARVGKHNKDRKLMNAIEATAMTAVQQLCL